MYLASNYTFTSLKGSFEEKKCPPEYDYSIQLRMIAVHVNENLWDIDIQWLFFFLQSSQGKQMLAKVLCSCAGKTAKNKTWHLNE